MRAKTYQNDMNLKPHGLRNGIMAHARRYQRHNTMIAPIRNGRAAYWQQEAIRMVAGSCAVALPWSWQAGKQQRALHEAVNVVPVILGKAGLGEGAVPFVFDAVVVEDLAGVRIHHLVVKFGLRVLMQASAMRLVGDWRDFMGLLDALSAEEQFAARIGLLEDGEIEALPVGVRRGAADSTEDDVAREVSTCTQEQVASAGG